MPKEDDDEAQVSTGGTVSALITRKTSDNKRELDQVIQSYRNILELTSSSTGFQQQKSFPARSTSPRPQQSV